MKMYTGLQVESPKADSTYNENLTIKKKKMLWGCLLCLNRHNPISTHACTTCNHPRPCNRFGHRDTHGRFYLCTADTSTVVPTLSLYRVGNDNDSSENSHRATRILMYHTSNILRECVATAFEAWEKDVDANLDADNDSVGSAASHSSWRSKASQREGISWERDPTKTLYDQVLANASSTTYDPSIGRYVDKELAAQSPVKLHDNMNMTYGQNMQNTHRELQKQVSEVKSRREDTEAKRFLHDFQPPSIDEPRSLCGLCELELPLSQLLGRITFKAISYWRQQHGAPISVNDYFDEDFGSNVIDKTAIQQQLGFDRRHSYSKQQNFSNKAYKKVLSNFLETNAALVQERPLSRMKQEIAVKQLRLRGEASDPSLRYQFNPQVQETRFIDREKGGSFLRSKYRDLGVLVSEQRKGEREDSTCRKRLLKLRMQAAVEHGAAVDKKPLFQASDKPAIQRGYGGSGDDRSVSSKVSSSSTSSKRRSRNTLKSSRHKSAPAKLRRSTSSKAAGSSDVSVASSTTSRRGYKRSSGIPHPNPNLKNSSKGYAISKRNSVSAHSALKDKRVSPHNSSLRSDASVVSRASVRSTASHGSKASRGSRVGFGRKKGVVTKRSINRLQPLTEVRKRGVAKNAVPAKQDEGQPLTLKGKITKKIAMTATIYDSAGPAAATATGALKGTRSSDVHVAGNAKPPVPVVLSSSLVQGAAPGGSKQLMAQLQQGGVKVLRGNMKASRSLPAPSAGPSRTSPLYPSEPYKGALTVQARSSPRLSPSPTHRAVPSSEEAGEAPSALVSMLRKHSGGGHAEGEQYEEEEEEHALGEEEEEEEDGEGVADLSLEQYLSSQPLPTDPPALSVFKEDASFDTYGDDTYGDDNTFPSLSEDAEEEEGVNKGDSTVRKALLLWGSECVEVAVGDEKLLEEGGDEGMSIDAYNWVSQGVISKAHCQENFFDAPPPKASRAAGSGLAPRAAIALLSGEMGKDKRGLRMQRDTRPAGPAIKLLSKGRDGRKVSTYKDGGGKFRSRAVGEAAKVNQMEIISSGQRENSVNGLDGLAEGSYFGLHGDDY